MKEKLKNLLLWIGGVFFIIMFAASYENYVLPAIILLIIGLLMIPPINEMIMKKIENKEKIKKYKKNKIIASIILFLVAMIMIGNTEATIETSTNKEKVEINSDVKSIDKDKVDSSIDKTINENNGEYIGERINGKKQGKGKFVWNDGTIYEGNFEEDSINGKGKLTYNNKETYEGDFVNNNRDGQGVFMFKNGDKYEGEWKLDKMTGKGTYTFANGDKYEGQFLNNQFNGIGTYTKGNKKYTGTWKDNNYVEK